MSKKDAPPTRDSTDVTKDTEHHLGGVAAAYAGVEAFAEPEVGRIEIEASPATQTDETASVVRFKMYTNNLTGRIALEPDQARAIADRLETAAATVEERRAGE